MTHPLLKQTAPEHQGFRLHPSIAAKWPDFVKQSTINGVHVLEGLKITRDTEDEVRAEAWHQYKDVGMVGVIVCARRDDPQLEIYPMFRYGHTELSTVTFARVSLSMHMPSIGHDFVMDSTHGIAGHGQGVRGIRFQVNFQHDWITEVFTRDPVRTDDDPPPYMSVPRPPEGLSLIKSFERTVALEDLDFPAWDGSYYTRPFPGQTGDQEIFGLSAIHADIWNVHSYKTREGAWWKQMRNELHRPGLFLNPDGTFPRDDDPRFDQLAGNDQWSTHSKGYRDQAWFKPGTNGSNMWNWKARTSSGQQWYTYDPQHWGLLPLTQVWWRYDDPALFWVLNALKEQWLFSTPVVDKGVSYGPGAARAQGRVLQAGACLWHATKDSRLLSRLKDLLKIHEDHAPLFFSRKDGIPPWEYGERVNGYYSMLHLPLPEETLQFVLERGKATARKVLSWCHDFGSAGDPLWAWPYLVRADGSPIGGPSISEWNLASMQLLDKYARADLNANENMVLSAILDQWIERMPIYENGPVPERIEWLV